MSDYSTPPEVSLLTVWRFVRRHWPIIVATSILSGSVLAAYRTTRPLEYTAVASFIPAVKRNVSPVSGLAAQFGLGGLVSEGMQSPQFFADLVRAPTLVHDVVLSRYRFTDNRTGQTRSGSLVDVYRAKGANEQQRVDDAARMLLKHVVTQVSPKTGLVTLQVTAASPPLAVQIAGSIINGVNAINLRLRQSQAAANREFAEEHVAELTAELRASEDRLQTFMQQNRDYRMSPRLQLEQERLSRDVAMRQEVYTNMASSYEQDRIESANDSPAIAVVDPPLEPARADPRGILSGAVAGLLLGAVVGVVLGGALEVVQHLRAMNDGAAGTAALG